MIKYLQLPRPSGYEGRMATIAEAVWLRRPSGYERKTENTDRQRQTERQKDRQNR